MSAQEVLLEELGVLPNADNGIHDDVWRNENYSLNGTDMMGQAVNESALPPHLRFHEGNVIQIISNAIIMLISGIGNVFVLVNLR
jgi:hypothetical protein